MFPLFQLCNHLPPRAEGYPWTLVYSTDKHGFSLKTLYRAMIGFDSPVLLVVKDTHNQVGWKWMKDIIKAQPVTPLYVTVVIMGYVICPNIGLSVQPSDLSKVRWWGRGGNGDCPRPAPILRNSNKTSLIKELPSKRLILTTPKWL